jgi:DNA polymerase (family 10)
MTETNRALAEIFSAMAGELAGRKANPHRIRAYRRAAELLQGLDEDIAAVAARGALQDLPGIGKDLAAKIGEFLATGTIEAYEELKTALPPEIARWTELPGLSEPIVRHLYVRLGMRSLDDVAALAHSHMLRTLPGFSGDEEALLAAIRAKTQPQG